MDLGTFPAKLLMNQSVATRIRASFHAVAPKLDALVSDFYDRLFARAPHLRAIFPADMSIQKYHLAAALALIARNIDCLDALEDSLMGLGAQHVRFGAKPEHYPMVRDALLEALAEQCGPHWTDQLRRDWTDAINAISAVMVKGAARITNDAADSMARGPGH
jgi:nitric oxide dioxygenase